MLYLIYFPTEPDLVSSAASITSTAPPKRRWVLALPLLIFVALAALFWFRLGADPARLPSALIGRQAPQTALPALPGLNDNGTPIPGLDPAALIGKVSIVNVWASWCVPCHDEAPILTELGARFADAGHELSLVGGPVRDAFLGRTSPDLDFTTDATPLACTADANASADATSSAIGLSSSTCLPARAARVARPACTAGGTANATASTSASSASTST